MKRIDGAIIPAGMILCYAMLGGGYLAMAWPQWTWLYRAAFIVGLHAIAIALVLVIRRPSVRQKPGTSARGRAIDAIRKETER